MAGNDPWLNWGWLKVGPFTPTEEDRVAAERRSAELDAERSRSRKDQDGLPSLMKKRGGGDPWFSGGGISVGPFTPDEASRQQAEMRAAQLKQAEAQAGAAGIKDRDMLPPKQFMQGPMQLTPEQMAASQGAMPQPQPDMQNNPQLSQPWPESARDWSIGQSLAGPFMEGGPEAWKKAREFDTSGANETTPTQSVVPQNNQAITDAAAAANAGTGDLATAAGIGGIDQPPTQEAPIQQGMSAQAQAIEDIKRQKAMIDGIYPQRPYDDTAQKQADAYSLDERDRAKSLAQLAFFSGVTQGAGGSWEGVGKGLAAAGGAYSEGFARYQKALMGKAERASDRQNTQYADDLSRTDAAVKLYSQEKDLEKGRMSEARLQGKERMDSIDDYFKERLKIAGGNEFAAPDQSLTDDIMRDWQLSRKRGDIVTTRNAADKPAS